MAKDPNEQQGETQEGAIEHDAEVTEVTEHQN